MGEAKRRRQNNPRTVNADAPEVRALFGKDGNPMIVALVGSGTILAKVLSRDLLTVPEPHGRPLRLAFGVWDRIRTGEMESWSCFLCGAKRAGLDDLSCIGIISPMIATKQTPAATLPICHTCDSISTEETRRRIEAGFPLAPAGRA